MINKKLEQTDSAYRLIAVASNDPRLNEKVKGQGVYFIITKNDEDYKYIILTWSYKPFSLFDIKS
jgi:rRNA-processing protein FCF1